MNDEEIDLRRRISAAERARAFTEDPLLVAAWEALDTRYLLAWRNSPADKPEMRERLWLYLQASQEVRAELNRALEDGEMARAALDDMRAGISNP